MFFTIITLFLIISLITSFMSGILANLTQDLYNLLISSEQKFVTYLQKIWSRYDETMYSLFLIDLFSVLFVVFIFGYSTTNSQDITIISVFAVATLFIFTIILFNLFFFYIGKRLSANLAATLLGFLYYTTFIFVPFIKRSLPLFIKISGKENDDTTIEEITDLVEEAREEGSIDAGEYRLLKNVMNFSDILVSDVMTPRIVLFSCEANTTVAEAIKLPELQMYSRFPIWTGSSLDDEALGYVITKEIFSAALSGDTSKTLKELSRTVYFIPENAGLDKALDTFLVNKQHLLLVVDEYGGVEGIITMEDVIETMLGVEIVDEADRVVDLRLLAKHRRELRLKESHG